MNPPTTERLAKVTVNTMSRTVTRQLLAAIFSGRFEADSRLVIQRVANEMGVSATPVREALGELAALGLIDLIPNRGPVVRPFGAKELREIYQIRALLESEATRLACGQIPRERLQENKKQLRDACAKSETDPMDPAFNLDLALHDIVRECCGNSRLAEEIERYRTLLPAIRDVAGDGPSTQERALKEHTKVINALLKEDADAAASAMRSHIESSGKAMEKALFA